MKTYIVTALYTMEVYFTVKAKSAKQAEKMVETYGFSLNDFEDGSLQDFVSIDSIEEVKE